MAAGFSLTNTINAFLNAFRGNANYTAVAGTFVQLHTGDPGANGTANVATGSTTRAALSLGAPAAGVISLTGTNPAWVNGGTSETITHISIWSDATAGTFSASGALTTSKAWASGDTLTLNSCTVSFAPAAS